MERSAIILAGGFSSRFGTDKGLLELADKPLIKHVFDKVKQISDEIIIVTNNKERLETYSSIIKNNVKFVVDFKKIQSPLIGALTGFQGASGKYSLLLPSDTPFVSVKVLDLLFELCHGRYAVIPRWPNSQIEPLHAVYNTQKAILACKLAVEEGKLNVRSMIERLGSVCYVSTVVFEKYDPYLLSFFNINTPFDFKKANDFFFKKNSNKYDSLF